MKSFAIEPLPSEAAQPGTDTPASKLLDQALHPLLRLAQLTSGADWVVVEAPRPEQRTNRGRRVPGSAPPLRPETGGGVRIGPMRCADAGDFILDGAQSEAIRLIADAVECLLEFERERLLAVETAQAAGLNAAEAHGASRREALYSQQMRRLAHTDVLTGLPNRRAFMKNWDDAAARSTRREHVIGLLLIDADRFKSINDNGGHALGDEVLRAIGATLMSVTNTPDFTARIGGDEFALCSVHTSEARLRELGERIREQFAVVAAELGVEATLSIGMVSSETCRPEQMLAQADLALYRSKEVGGDAARLFVCVGGDTEGEGEGA